jgi:hypothetical protein
MVRASNEDPEKLKGSTIIVYILLLKDHVDIVILGTNNVGVSGKHFFGIPCWVADEILHRNIANVGEA